MRSCQFWQHLNIVTHAKHACNPQNTHCISRISQSYCDTRSCPGILVIDTCLYIQLYLPVALVSIICSTSSTHCRYIIPIFTYDTTISSREHCVWSRLTPTSLPIDKRILWPREKSLPTIFVCVCRDTNVMLSLVLVPNIHTSHTKTPCHSEMFAGIARVAQQLIIVDSPSYLYVEILVNWQHAMHLFTHAACLRI